MWPISCPATGEISPISLFEKSHIVIYAIWYQNICVEKENRDEVSRLFGSYVGQHWQWLAYAALLLCLHTYWTVAWSNSRVWGWHCVAKEICVCEFVMRLKCGLNCSDTLHTTNTTKKANTRQAVFSGGCKGMDRQQVNTALSFHCCFTALSRRVWTTCMRFLGLNRMTSEIRLVVMLLDGTNVYYKNK